MWAFYVFEVSQRETFQGTVYSILLYRCLKELQRLQCDTCPVCRTPGVMRMTYSKLLNIWRG